MNMRKIIENIENLFEDFSGWDTASIHVELRNQFWYLYHNTEDAEIWRHRDDMVIGEYVIHFKDNVIVKIDYRNYASKMFNRSFTNATEFKNHLHEIMDEPTDVEGGLKFLKSIADDLKKKKKK